MKTLSKRTHIHPSIFCLVIFVFQLALAENSFSQDHLQTKLMNCTTFEDSCLAIGNAFINKMKKEDFNSLQSLFSDNVFFRALIPSSLVTLNSPDKVAHQIHRWFYVDDSEEYKLIDSSVDVVIDCLHISYKIFETYQGKTYCIEQQLYCEISSGKINKLSLMCSGFRKVLVS